MSARVKKSKVADPDRRRIKRNIMARVRWLYAIFALFGIAIIVMIIATQYGVNGTPLRNRSDLKCFRTLVLHASRGNIYSHDHQILTTDSPAFLIRLDFSVADLTDEYFNANVGALADSLACLLPRYSRDHYYNRLRQIRGKALEGGPGSRSQQLMKETVNQLELDRMRTFPIFNQGQLGGGFIYVQNPERYKPFGTLASRTLGKPGETGIEYAFDSILTGTPGQNRVVRLVRDVWVPVVDDDNREAENGKDVVTTLDVMIQDIVERELAKQLIDNEATAGTAVVMEVATGEIRAISNLTRHGEKVYDDFNHAMQMRNEPGSTFKLVSLMALLDDAGLDINTTVDCTTSARYEFKPTRGPSHTIRDDHAVGVTNIKGIMEQSSNIGFVKMIDRVYRDNPKRFVDYICNLGFNVPLNMQLVGGLAPIIKDPSVKRANDRRYWDALSLAKMAYGYAIELTPLHTLTLYNAIANDGVMVAPRLVTEIKDENGSVEKFGVEVLNPQICSPKTLKLVQSSLEGVVENGTGRKLKNEYYSIAGKTGTAQVAMGPGGYKDSSGGRKYMGTFVGYFPADKPRYTVIVSVVTYIPAGSSRTYYGATLALPGFKRIADRIYALDAKQQEHVDRVSNPSKPIVKSGSAEEIYRVSRVLNFPTALSRRSRGWGDVVVNDGGIDIVAGNSVDSLMPSVVGMGLKDALYLLESRGMSVAFSGAGVVSAQSPEAGEVIYPDQSVRLELSRSDNVARRREKENVHNRG